MEKPIITDLFKKECSGKFGIRPNHAIEAAENPDRTEVIESDGLTLRIHMKLVQQANPPHYLLITERLDKGKRSLDFGLKVYADLVDNLPNKSPLEVLQLIAERFGMEIQVGDTKAKFVSGEKIPVKDANDIKLLQIAEPRKQSFVSQLYFKLETGTPMVANCALCYCLDVKEYLTWLNSIN